MILVLVPVNKVNTVSFNKAQISFILNSKSETKMYIDILLWSHMHGYLQ